MIRPKFSSYRRINGHDEFQEFYEELPTKQREKLTALIKCIERQGLLTAIKMEWIKKLDKNIYEIRSQEAKNIQRCLYFHDDGNRYIITHGFTKKTQKTPPKEIQHAKELRTEYYSRKDDKY